MVIERAVHIACKTLMGAASSFPLEEKLAAYELLSKLRARGRGIFFQTFMEPQTVNQDMKCHAYDQMIKWNVSRTKE